MKNMAGVETQMNLQRLLFRRQFLLGPSSFAPTQYWSSIELPHGLTLSVHDDLPFVSESNDKVTATLIGTAIDPHHPHLTEPDILHNIITRASDIKTLIDDTSPLSGRWVIIFQNCIDTYLFTDPCGFRQVFYYSDGLQFWCGSQPEIIKIKQQMSLATGGDFIDFLMRPEFARSQSARVGSRTLYENCFHLMPNHYLIINQVEPIRFFPSCRIPKKNIAQVIELSATILKGAMTAVTKRYDVCMALTAGWDSRVLLAASRDVCEHIEYFVYRTGTRPESNPDVWVPKKIAKNLNINFIVKNPAEELPGWFISILSQNVTGARIQMNTYHIFDKLIRGESRININGNASEICRNFFDKYCKIEPNEMNTTDLSEIFGYKGVQFVNQEFNEWRKGVNYELLEGLNVLDMLYWEQRLGNWGAQYPAEQDIAIDELSPFNCRLLIETLSATPRHLRAEPDYILYRELIRFLWPETLSVPINPLPKGDPIAFLWKNVEPHLPLSMVHMLKRLLK